MPLRPTFGTQRWSLRDVPILPFLAPRLFEPWPSRGDHQRNHTVSEAGSQEERCLEQERSEHKVEAWHGARKLGSAEVDQGLSSKALSSFQPMLSFPRHKRRDVQGPARYRDQKLHKSFRKIPTAVTPHVRQRTKRLATPYTPLAPPKRTGKSTDVSSFFRYSETTRTLALHKIHRGSRTLGDLTTSRSDTWRSPDQEISCMKYDSNIEGLLAVDVDTGSNRENLLALQDSLQTSPTSIELLNHWKQLDSHDREYLWPKLLIKVARESPHRLLKLLGGTWVAPYPPRQLVSDAIDYIIFYYLDNLQPSEESHTTAVSLYKAIKGLLLQGPLDYVQLSRHSIYILTRHLAKQQYVADCYHFLNQIGNPLTVHTLSHFVADLIVEPRYGNLAYDIFTRIGNMNPDFNFQSLQSLCTTVLLHSSSEMQVSHSEKFEYMLKCGLKPNIITYNVLLLKLLKAGDTEASWEIFQMMKENGPEPDVYTMSTLLNDAKLRRDTTSVSEILKYANDKGLRSVHITNDALHMTTLLMERARSHEVKRAAAAGEHPRPQKRTSFEVMLPYYCKHFNFKPLAHLLPGLSTTYPELIDQGALSPENIDSVETIDAERLRKVDPDNASLVIMITALLKDYHDPDTPKWFYEHFKNLIQARDPLVTRLASANNGSYAALLYNSILMALGRHASNIPLCLQILGEMSAPKTSLDSLQGESLKHSSINEPSLVPKPTSYTWGIFTDMFMEHRQPRAAEKVISMMRERGIQPTKMNWAVLLKGYAKLQDTRAVVDTLDRSERGGFPPDRVTWKLLRGIVDKRAVDEGWRASRLLRMKEEVDRLDGHTQQGVSEETIVPLHEMDVKKYGIGDMDVREPMT